MKTVLLVELLSLLKTVILDFDRRVLVFFKGTVIRVGEDLVGFGFAFLGLGFNFAGYLLYFSQALNYVVGFFEHRLLIFWV
jgi:hypothetical protein